MKKSYVTQTCCFIGPPDVPRCDEEKIITRVRYILKPLMANGVHYFGVGGGLGYDMAVADYLLKLRD